VAAPPIALSDVPQPHVEEVGDSVCDAPQRRIRVGRLGLRRRGEEPDAVEKKGGKRVIKGRLDMGRTLENDAENCLSGLLGLPFIQFQDAMVDRVNLEE
jgi:hypothetical protein